MFRKRGGRRVIEDDASSESSGHLTLLSLPSQIPFSAENDDYSNKGGEMEESKESVLGKEVQEGVGLISDPVLSSSEDTNVSLGVMEELEPSCFEAIQRELNLKIPELMEDNTNNPHDSVSSQHKILGLKKEIEVELTENKSIQQERTCVSPCSSVRSHFSDSVAAKFLNSNFNNRQCLEDSWDDMRHTPIKGSMRQRYTMKRMQSLLSRQSTLSSSLENGTIRRSLSRQLSGMSRDASGSRLSRAYSFIRLESCIRKAWNMSANEDTPRTSLSRRQSTRAMRSDLRSSRRGFNKKSEVSFVPVSMGPVTGLRGSQEQAVLNPHYGDDALTIEEDPCSEDGDTLGSNSIVLRTPLQRITPIDENYTRCERDFEEGMFNNPLEVCSFRSYDSDTELELTSFKYRNPISKLLELERVRGVSKDGISLAELEGDEYSSSMLMEAKTRPLRDSMLDKYLTQIAINDVVENPEGEGNVVLGTCQEGSVPQELDDELRFLLLERFLLDNVCHELDVNLEAMELASIQQRRPLTSRGLRRT